MKKIEELEQQLNNKAVMLFNLITINQQADFALKYPIALHNDYKVWKNFANKLLRNGYMQEQKEVIQSIIAEIHDICTKIKYLKSYLVYLLMAKNNTFCGSQSDNVLVPVGIFTKKDLAEGETLTDDFAKQYSSDNYSIIPMFLNKKCLG